MAEEQIIKIVQESSDYIDAMKTGLTVGLPMLLTYLITISNNKKELKREKERYENEISKIREENNNAISKHKLEIKVKILEENLIIVDEYNVNLKKLRDKIFKLRKTNKLFKDLKETTKQSLRSKEKEYLESKDNLEVVIRKLKMIGAFKASIALKRRANIAVEFKNSIFTNKEAIYYPEKEDWKSRIREINNSADEFDKEIHKFFESLN